MNYEDIIVVVAILIAAIIIISILIFNIAKRTSRRHEDNEVRRAGRRGEIIASNIIEEVLRQGDYHFNNIKIKIDGRETELDNVIVNSRGIFIIEVKNYSGTLIGDIDDETWTKQKVSRGNKVYVEQVRNPIGQVDRQIYLLKQYLKHKDIKNVWIEGYAYLVEHNSPVRDKRILSSTKDIHNAIHNGTNNNLNSNLVKQINRALS